MTRLRLADFVFICATTTSLAAYAQGTEPHGWLNTETLKTRSCDFEFKNGYPVGDTAQRLLNLQKFNRAVEVYLTQLMPVSEIALREGMRVRLEKAGAGGDLGKFDGRSDSVADREHRDGLCDEPPRPRLAMAALPGGIGANAIRANSSESGGYK